MFVVNPLVEFYRLSKDESNDMIIFRGDERIVYQHLSPLDLINFNTITNGNGIIKRKSKFISWLISKNFISEKNDNLDLIHNPFNRQISSYSFNMNLQKSFEVHKKISESTFLIVGVGGVGTNVISQLTRIGVRKFILIDIDKIEESNLNRQILFNKTDIGKYKVLVAKRAIKKFDSNCIVKTIRTDALSKLTFNKIEKYSFDYAIISADSNSLLIHQKYSSLFYNKKIPYAFLGYVGLIAKIGPLIFRANNCCGCCISETMNFFNTINKIEYKNCINIPPSSMQINSIVASMYIEELIKFHSQEDYENKTLYFNLKDYRLEIEKITRSKQCKI